MEKERQTGYTLTVRLGPNLQAKLTAYAERNETTLAGAVRCWLMSLPEPAQRDGGGEKEGQDVGR